MVFLGEPRSRSGVHIRQVFSAKRTSGIFEKCSRSLSASPPCLCLGHTVSASTSSHAVYTHRWGGAPPPRTQALRHDSPSTSNTFCAHAPSAFATHRQSMQRVDPAGSHSRPKPIPHPKSCAGGRASRRALASQAQPGRARVGCSAALSPSEDDHRHVEVPEHQSRRTAT